MKEMTHAIDALDEVVRGRKETPAEGSYTCYLFAQGKDKILKKCGEECAEVIIAAKNGDREALTEELADLVYHLLVLMAAEDLPLSMLNDVLEERRKKIGNLKSFHEVDRES